MVDISKQKPTYQIEPLRGEENYELWSIRMSAHALVCAFYRCDCSMKR
jgi:hypothetical protein